MTIADLIQILQTYPSDMTVVTIGGSEMEYELCKDGVRIRNSDEARLVPIPCEEGTEVSGKYLLIQG